MDGDPGGEAGTPDTSPWQRGSDAVFDHPDKQPFAAAASNVGSRSDAVNSRSGVDDVDVTPVRSARPTDAGDQTTLLLPTADRRGLVIGVIAVVSLLVVASIVWSQRDTGDDAKPGDRVVVGSETGVVVGESGGNDADDVPLADERTVGEGQGNEVGSSVAPGTRSGDVAIGADSRPLATVRTGVCLTPRLPSRLELRWSAGLPGVRRVQTPVAVGDRTIVAVVGIDSPDAELARPLALTAVDAETGVIRWTSGLGLGSDWHQVIGVTNDVVVVEQFLDDRTTHQLVGVDEEFGEERWRIEFESTWAVTIDREFGLIVVDVEPTGSDDVGVTQVIDPLTGAAVVSLPGRLVSVESVPAGFPERGSVSVADEPVASESIAVVVSRAGDEVLGAVIDTTGVTPSTTGDRELLGATVPSTRPYAIVDGRFISTLGDSTLSWMSFGSGALATKMPWWSTADEIDEPGSVGALAPLGGTSVAVSGSGMVFGTRLFDTIFADVGWQVKGVISASVPSDRGRLLFISSDGGSIHQVVDGTTGRRIVELPLGAGAATTFAMYPNGAVFLDRSGRVAERVAIDLDGTVMWTLPGNGPLAIGDRTVIEVEARSDPGGIGSEPIRLLAYGDDLSQPATC